VQLLQQSVDDLSFQLGEVEEEARNQFVDNDIFETNNERDKDEDEKQ